jgi:hypothetical protein
MKYKLPLLLMFALPLATLGQSSAQRGPLQKVIVDFFDAISTLNESNIRSYLTSDFTLLEGGQAGNTDTLLNALSKRKATDYKRVNTIDFIKSEQQKNTGWVAFYNTADITIKGERKVVKWLESAVLVKRGKSWKIQMLHSTKVK